MSRFLIVVPPLAGHILPPAAVASELERAGHEVGWVGPAPLIESLVGATGRVFDAPVPPDVAAALASRRGGGTVRTVHLFWERVVLPLARGMLDATDAATRAFRPDVVFADQHAVAGPLAAARAGVAWATSAPTVQATTRAFELVPAAGDWLRTRMQELRREAGVGGENGSDVSPELVIVYSVPEFAGEAAYPPSFRFVGAALGARPEPGPPLLPADGRPRVFVSLGTTTAGVDEARFLAALAQGIADEPVQVIAVAACGVVHDPPPNLHLHPWVSQLDVLRRVDAVVSHGGHNTVVEALACGLPVAVAPTGLDHGIVAAQVEAAGAGFRVRFRRSSAPELRGALQRLVGDGALREAAARLARLLAAAGGAPAAAAALEELARP